SLACRRLVSLVSLLAGLALLAAGPAWGEDTVLHAKRLLDVRSGRMIEDGVVVVADGHIRAAGPRGAVAVPAGARWIELGDRTLLPGLFDMHVHLSIGGPHHHNLTGSLFVWCGWSALA